MNHIQSECNFNEKNDFQRNLSRKYCRQFGYIAIKRAFITQEQLVDAINRQTYDREHKLIGTVLFEKGWLTYKQIELILTDVLGIKGGHI